MDRLDSSSKRSLGRLAASACVFGTLGLSLSAGVSGCDTVARIVWSDIAFTEIYSAGISTVGTGFATCEGTSGKAVMRIAMRDSNDHPITPDTVLNGAEIDFSTDAISFTDSAIFELPDSDCDAGCSSGFSCVTPPTVNEASFRRCTNSSATGVSVDGAPRFVSETTSTQLFGVMLELTNSWRGELPESITNLNPDFDGDGRGDAGASLALQGFNNDRATDSRGSRLSLLSSMVTNWNDIRLNAQQRYQTETLFGFWTFGGSGAVTQSQIANLDSTPDDTEFVASGGRAGAAVTAISGNDGNAEQAAVFESMVTVLESNNGYNNPQYANAEKVLTVVVDGPDGLRLPAFDAERVISAAQAINARVFIVHVDTPIQTTGINTSTGDEIPIVPDDPEYYENQGDGFTAEADCDCKNFEVCRTVTQYSSQPGSNTDVPSAARAGNLFCVPEYGEDGRIGPVDDYARIACATGGGYIYVPSIGDLLTQADWLPYALDGLWEVPINVEAISRESVPSGQPYLIQTNMAITLGGDNNLYSHTPNPGATTPGDSRTVVFANY
jgi:hypothetical protein